MRTFRDKLEADDSSGVIQLDLFGVPAARLSHLVEVADGDWRPRDTVSMEDHIAHSERTFETCRRRSVYHQKKTADQRQAAVVMERKDPGSTRLPLRDVRARWEQLGFFDETDANVETATAHAR